MATVEGLGVFTVQFWPSLVRVVAALTTYAVRGYDPTGIDEWASLPS